jgi:hypothetical protein
MARILGVDSDAKSQLDALREQITAGDRDAIKAGAQAIEQSDDRAAQERAENGDMSAVALGEHVLRNLGAERPLNFVERSGRDDRILD